MVLIASQKVSIKYRVIETTLFTFCEKEAAIKQFGLVRSYLTSAKGKDNYEIEPSYIVTSIATERT